MRLSTISHKTREVFTHSFSCLNAMGKVTGVSRYFVFRQQLIDNKNFLVLLAEAKSNKAREKLLKGCALSQIHVLKDLILNIGEKNIEIDRTIFQNLKKKKKVQELNKLIRRVKQSPDASEKKLKFLLLKFNPVLPFVIRSVLQ